MSYIIEGIGYAASVVLLLAMLMTSVVKLRIINTLGCILFVIYALLIKSYPVALMNTAIACVNIVFLIRIRTQESKLKILRFNGVEELIHMFVDKYKPDITTMFPEYTQTDKHYSCSFLVMRNMEMAGVFIAHDEGNGNLIVELDYVIPAYRDCLIGDFVFNKSRNIFKELKCKKITEISGSPRHSKYLKKMGFKEISSEAGIKVFELDIE
ncbi:MAG: YgjV family protein [Salinivirgaceae bacterium]|nr:YgjV family protein [Salinivirgaceae bacterium]